MSFFQRIVDVSQDIVLVADDEQLIRYASPSLTRQLGWTTESLIGRPAHIVIPPSSLDLFHAIFRTVREGAEAHAEFELALLRSDGSRQWVEGRLANLLDDPDVRGIVATMRDIDARRTFEHQLITKAFYDDTTGLPSRALYLDRLEQQLHLSRHEIIVKVLFIRIDNFRAVQSAVGWQRSDALIGELGERLDDLLPSDGLLGRHNSHAFVMALTSTHSNRGEMVMRVREATARPFELDGRQIKLTTSIGLATATHGQIDAEALVDRADAAAREAKRMGVGQAVAWTDDMNTRAGMRDATRRDLQLAIDRDQLRLHYQPIVDIDSSAVVGIEALVRWEHPLRGLVPPSEFIAIAEETGMIDRLGRWVLERATAAAAKLNLMQATAPVFVTVNVTQRQLASTEFMSELRAALSRSGLAPHLLQFDMNEATLGNAGSLIGSRLRELRKLNIGIAIDDFGTGFSSLASLKDAPATHIKVDRSFTSDLLLGGAGLVGGIVSLAHEMGFATIAEGVETVEQFTELRRLGCSMSQGWFHGRPLPFDELVAALGLSSSVGGSGGVADR